MSKKKAGPDSNQEPALFNILISKNGLSIYAVPISVVVKDDPFSEG